MVPVSFRDPVKYRVLLHLKIKIGTKNAISRYRDSCLVRLYSLKIMWEIISLYADLVINDKSFF